MKKLKTKKRGSVICDQCGYEIKDPVRQLRCSVKTGRPGRKIMYGFSECQVKFNNTPGRYKRVNYNKDIGNNHELQERICLGVLCNGEKTFMSEGVHNRICIPCINAMRNIT